MHIFVENDACGIMVEGITKTYNMGEICSSTNVALDFECHPAGINTCMY